MNIDEWRYATDKEIEQMTYEEAKSLLLKQIELGKDSDQPGYIGPRKHLIKAMQLVLDRAEGR